MSHFLRKSIKTKKIPPLSTLNPEYTRIWIGWNELGDREVAREAAAKGFYVSLAITFLSHRRNLTTSNAEEWFNNEVLIWVSELLERKQIYKASYVLSNINVDPVVKLTETFRHTENREMREYIGGHLIKSESLDDELKNVWVLLEAIENDFKSNHALTEEHGKLTVFKVENLDEEIQYKLAVKLFFKSYDFQLEPFLNYAIVWKYLLAHNRVDLLRLWISMHFSDCVCDIGNLNIQADTLEKLLNLFQKYVISPEMINVIVDDSYGVTPENQNILLNEFVRYGLFCSEDMGKFSAILKRLRDTRNIPNFREIMTLKSCILDFEKFYSLLTDFCVKNKFYNILNICAIELKIPDVHLLQYESKYTELIVDVKHATANLDNALILRNNLLKVSQLLDPSLEEYLRKNPLILMSMVLFNNDDYSFSSRKENLFIKEDKIDCSILFEELPLLTTIHKKFLNEIQENKFTFYDLLQQQGLIIFKKLCNFRGPDRRIAHFNKEDLVEKYAYNKKLDFMFFLKQARPSLAYKHFMVDCLMRKGAVENEDKLRILKKVRKLSIENFNHKEVTSACVVFLEMMRLNSNSLRIDLKTASIIYGTAKFEETTDVVELFRTGEVQEISKILEDVVMTQIEYMFKMKKTLVSILNEFEIVYQYNSLHDIRLPELLLKLWAKNNMWLPFLIYAQIKNYPVEQIKDLAQYFKNPNLLEHITHSVLYTIESDDYKEKALLERDSRSCYLSRIGLRRPPETDRLTSSISSMSSTASSEISSGFSDFSENETLDMKTTLLQALIRCHNSVDPPGALLQACQFYRNPLLAVLATSYEPDSVVTNWLTWLAVSTELCDPVTNYESISFSSQSVTEILRNVLKHRHPKTLLESFEIFLPDNPLKIFVEFLNHCINFNTNPEVLLPIIMQFQKKLKYIRSNSIIPQIDQEVTYLNNKIWVQNTALSLLAYTVEYNFTSLYDQIQFLEKLCEFDVAKVLLDPPNFTTLLQVLKALHLKNCDVKPDLSVIYNSVGYKKTVGDCLNKLIEKEMFEVALEVAQIEQFSVERLLVLQWKSKYKSRRPDNNDFWQECNESFVNYAIDPKIAVDFYKDFVETTEKLSEKYELFSLAYDWARKQNMPDLTEIESQMWFVYMNLSETCTNVYPKESNAKNLYKEMLIDLENINSSVETLKEEDIQKLNKTIDVLLNRCCFWEALKLEKLFKHKNENLEILKLCASIAEGILSTGQMSCEEKILMIAGSRRTFNHRRRNFFSSRLSSLSSTTSQSTAVTCIQMDQPDQLVYNSLASLETLLEKLKAGINVGRNIFMTYRISVNIDFPYHLIVENDDPMKMLKDALDEDCRNKLEVIHDFIYVYKWPKEKVADFICEQLVNAINEYIESKLMTLSMWDLNLDVEFHLILQILHEHCSLVGAKLYSYANALHMSHTTSSADFKITELSLICELLIRSHDCFTSDCNMEGISQILKKSQAMITLLLSMRSWKLIVRLLTGIARYTEMNYVFQILRENDQFEYLLSKGSKKDNSLKLALLDYLKKYCPNNEELYRIVALHFNLYSEVAQLWEREAQNIIRNLIEISKLEMQNNGMNLDAEPFVVFTNTDGTKLCLNKAMSNYTHATEYHLQGQKLARAMNAAKQGELIALQMSMLKGLPYSGTTICFLHLTEPQIHTLIMSHLSFSQSLILTQSYNFSVDWATVLFEQYVINGQTDYLDCFVKHLPLTDNLVHDISRRFLRANCTTPRVLKSMKDIVDMVTSVHMKYKIASELGFMDIVEELLETNQLAFLKDTVWKKGYRSGDV